MVIFKKEVRFSAKNSFHHKMYRLLPKKPPSKLLVFQKPRIFEVNKPFLNVS